MPDQKKNDSRKTSEILDDILKIIKASNIVNTSHGLSRNDFSRIKNRQHTPTLTKLKNISSAISVTTENLIELDIEFKTNIEILERTLS
jgi:hypothetical protein